MISNVKNRPNKIAKGFTKHEERRDKLGKVRVSNPKHPAYDADKHNTIIRLIVKGTCDRLGAYKGFRFKRIRKPHDTDKDYFKDVIVLSDRGKEYYKRKLKEKQNENK